MYYQLFFALWSSSKRQKFFSRSNWILKWICSCAGEPVSFWKTSALRVMSSTAVRQALNASWHMKTLLKSSQAELFERNHPIIQSTGERKACRGLVVLHTIYVISGVPPARVGLSRARSFSLPAATASNFDQNRADGSLTCETQTLRGSWDGVYKGSNSSQVPVHRAVKRQPKVSSTRASSH